MFAEPGTYDQIITMFSPDGRLLQVEYAIEAVNRGATVLGVSCLEGIVLGAEEDIRTNLQGLNFSRKIYEVDEHLGAAVVGLAADARILIDQARIDAQINRLMYDESIDVEVVTKHIGDTKQLYTQHAGVRPFGVSIIFGGVDKTGNRLFATDPSGSYRAYRAVALGHGREVAEPILNEEYHEGLKLNEAIKLSVKCLVKAIETQGKKSAIRIAVILSETKRFRILTAEEVEPYIRQGTRIGQRKERRK
ncbi:MAG: archaeal proteasome endopeptidase complex subunit alpha [Candidatus Bathyarchaeota archaeon]|nr:archaeal proteasome endopeptidase complex subunit alpha [Candidatus Bathyarchaeota archaeon]MDH5419408.1 archaeal proteasome endopeptidase complex subunit alpha [Candidatus Bathyarchaeota archaeon]MDH5623725.1 archaeal proteasome endopeptidase complex subunit alpha [Candidatus Bathyarchaeota archaeon]MDH5635690.1 archaeal proteasome endopeptidase complex subunit alpha [Candidatus Bathyarchaeota archaeon]MDH5701238.1 archaeal proteasome endopeptidase complex subunit alpha [Candidatus Bathyarc